MCESSSAAHFSTLDGLLKPETTSSQATLPSLYTRFNVGGAAFFSLQIHFSSAAQRVGLGFVADGIERGREKEREKTLRQKGKKTWVSARAGLGVSLVKLVSLS